MSIDLEKFKSRGVALNDKKASRGVARNDEKASEMCSISRVRRSEKIVGRDDRGRKKLRMFWEVGTNKSFFQQGREQI